MDIKITTPEQLKSLIKDKTLPSKSNVFVEGLSIDGDTLSQLNEFDPKVLHFNNCRFIGDEIFDGAFSSDNILEEFSITNSHLTDDQGNALICSLATESLQCLDLSNNDLGKKTLKRTFLEHLIEHFSLYYHLKSIKLINNGFSQDEKTEFISYIRNKVPDSLGIIDI